MYFEPPSHYRSKMKGSCARTRTYLRKSDTPKIEIDGQTIVEVSETKFLGVTIDNKLSWIPHIENLHKKLKSVTGTLKRIKNNIPEQNFKSIYYALFESHMRYCITVFGGASSSHLDKLFRIQKHCLRILFGDFEEYMQKRETCARTREYRKQTLGSDYYCKEHTKPLFHKLEILSFKNIYNYQTCLEMLKILKFRLPIQLYDLLKLSPRNNGVQLILPTASKDYIYKASKLWNIAAKIFMKNDDLLSIKIGTFKSKLKECLLNIQNRYSTNEWCPYNFNLDTVLKK